MIVATAKKEFLLNFRSQQSQIHDLSHSRPRHMPEAGEVSVVGDDALPDEVLEVDRECHVSRDARDAFER